MDDPTQPDNELLDLPKSLIRDPITNKAEYMVMSDTEELNEVEVKAKPAKAIKAKSQKLIVKKAKASKEVKVKKAPKSVTDKTEKDKFGLRKGSARSEAAAMYARKSGATLTEVKERVGSIQLNVLTTLAKNGWEVEKDAEKRAGGRPVTRYWLRAAK